MVEIKEQVLTEELKKKIYEGFSHHAIEMTGHDEKFDSIAFVAMEGAMFAGAVVVERFWHALHVKYVYVSDHYRNQGLGSRLMDRALAYGLEQNCPFAFVETMSFQALDFYQKMGFVLDFTRSGYAHGTSFHYLSKKLTLLTDCHIRPLREQDIVTLSDLYFPWSTREETVAKWTGYLNEQQIGSRMACVVEQNGKIVGYGSLLRASEYLHFRHNKIPEINDIWVYEESRKKGIATTLIAHLEHLAKQEGYTTIGIGVGLYRDYGAAQRLYFRLGYAPDGEGITYKHTAVVPGEKYAVDDDLILWLTKPLSSQVLCQNGNARLKKIFFLIGASGSGKTTATKELERRGLANFKILYFDSIGIPSIEEMEAKHGGPEEWQKIKTIEWVKVIKKDVLPDSHVLFDGQTRPSFIEKACHKSGIKEFEIILFDCSDEERTRRLVARGQANLANENMMNWARYLRKECQDRGYLIIDTTHMKIEEMVSQLLTHLHQ